MLLKITAKLLTTNGDYFTQKTKTLMKTTSNLSLLARAAKIRTVYLPNERQDRYRYTSCCCCSHLEHKTSVKRFVSLQFLNLRHSIGLLGRAISPSQGRYLTKTQNKHRQQTSMPRVVFEPTIPVFERAKTVHASHGAATVMGTATLA
jgi:hypothetical protein